MKTYNVTVFWNPGAPKDYRVEAETTFEAARKVFTDVIRHSLGDHRTKVVEVKARKSSGSAFYGEN
jgi:hypothetical protein